MMTQMAQMALSNLIIKNMKDNELILNENELIDLLKNFIGEKFNYKLESGEYIQLRITKNE